MAELIAPPEPPLPEWAGKLAAPSDERPDLPMHEMMREIARRRWFAGDENGALYAAEKAAPYFAPKLSATEFKGDVNTTVTDTADRPPRETREEWIARRKHEVGAALLMGAPAGTAD